MGPRFCKRGNDVVAFVLGRQHELQWGHAFVSVETGGAGVDDGAADGTSMGPRFCKRGNGLSHAPQPPRYRTSMGPRFCKRGNIAGAIYTGVHN